MKQITVQDYMLFFAPTQWTVGVYIKRLFQNQMNDYFRQQEINQVISIPILPFCKVDIHFKLSQVYHS